MKKITLILMLLAAGLMAVSCGHDDEPVDPNDITRVQDGNGKVFLENGTLVDANLDYTQAELEQALQQYDWEREYCFFYDNHNISSRISELRYMPIIIHTNGTIDITDEYPLRQREYTIKGKILTMSLIEDVWSSYYELPRDFVIVALDIKENGGRMIMDTNLKGYEYKNYDSNSISVRMVWKAKM